MDVSNMVFQPDLGKGIKSLCSDPRIRHDAVRIKLEPTSHEGVGVACASLGHEPLRVDYGAAPLTKDMLGDLEGEHWLKFSVSPKQIKCDKAHRPQDPRRPHQGVLYFEAGARLESVPLTIPTQDGWLGARDAKGEIGIFPPTSSECGYSGDDKKYDALM